MQFCWQYLILQPLHDCLYGRKKDCAIHQNTSATFELPNSSQLAGFYKSVYLYLALTYNNHARIKEEQQHIIVSPNEIYQYHSFKNQAATRH